MKIDIKHIAKLSRLRLDDEQTNKFQKQMQDIVTMVESLCYVSGEDLSLNPDNTMKLRKDVIEQSLSRKDILSNAPSVEAGCFVVPKTVDAE